MKKKHTKFFMVIEGGRVKYIKLDSDLIFSKEEGVNTLMETYPEATKIKGLTAKAVKFLDLQ